MQKDKIRKKIHEQLPLIKRDYHVKRIGIFGSVARNEQKKGSDVDILVEFKTPIGFFQFINLENFLSRTINHRVDLVSKKAIKPTLKKEIFKDIMYV